MPDGVRQAVERFQVAINHLSADEQQQQEHYGHGDEGDGLQTVIGAQDLILRTAEGKSPTLVAERPVEHIEVFAVGFFQHVAAGIHLTTAALSLQIATCGRHTFGDGRRVFGPVDAHVDDKRCHRAFAAVEHRQTV